MLVACCADTRYEDSAFSLPALGILRVRIGVLDEVRLSHPSGAAAEQLRGRIGEWNLPL